MFFIQYSLAVEPTLPGEHSRHGCVRPQGPTHPGPSKDRLIVPVQASPKQAESGRVVKFGCYGPNLYGSVWTTEGGKREKLK